ncbi:hypothetical protein F506_08085 [Herbaspirillum hiltneri N3]|uniref:MFS transporter n=1 Tax=Herbaspirillum hiltneri N3 TaxID=1262470 RepID=A0ABM5UZL9_9BURK|nr:hypothetical protein F506_08085 [Herbaspirillum hiltneri N3]
MAHANVASAGALDAGTEIGKRVIGKLHRKIVWYCFFLFMINYLDRVNVGFAALTMNADLGLSAKVYGLGAGIFFLGYIAFEIPSNMILHKVGPRIWIARIMVTWGIVGCAMASRTSLKTRARCRAPGFFISDTCATSWLALPLPHPDSAAVRRITASSGADILM